MQITCLFDPLCGWCYGASPAIDRISGVAGVEFKLAPTGMFAGRAPGSWTSRSPNMPGRMTAGSPD